MSERKGVPWAILLACVLWAFVIGLAASDVLMEWLGTPKALRTIAAEYEKAADRKEKIAKFYEELDRAALRP